MRRLFTPKFAPVCTFVLATLGCVFLGWALYQDQWVSLQRDRVWVFLQTLSLGGVCAVLALSGFRYRVREDSLSGLILAFFLTEGIFQGLGLLVVLGPWNVPLSTVLTSNAVALAGIGLLYGVKGYRVAPALGSLGLGVLSLALPLPPALAAVLLLAGFGRVWAMGGGRAPLLYCAVLLFGGIETLACVTSFSPSLDESLLPQFIHAATFLPVFVASLFTNISDFAMMYRNSRFLESVLENIPNMIFVKDAKELRFELFNLAGEKLIGMKRQDLIGKNDYDFFPKDQADHFTAKDREVLEQKTLVDIAEEPLDTQAGRRWLHTQKIPILSETGKPLYLLGISEDITEARALKQELEQTQLNAIQQAKMASLGQMAAGMAHEINNPLHIILGNMERLERMVERGESSENLKERFDKVSQTCQRIASIINALRAYARDVPNSPKEMTEVTHLIDETLSFCSERFRNNGVELKVLGEKDISLRCRPVEISQVLLNLLNNAFDAIEALEEKWIEVEVRTQSDDLLLSVRDSGTSLDPKFMERLTEPFFTTKPVGKGIGLGLSISKGIVESHGGSLYVDPNDRNTRFVIRLPECFRRSEVA